MPEHEDLPRPSPELVALRAFAEAHWRTLSPRKRLLFQKSLGEVLHEIEEAPLTMRPPSAHAEVRAARMGARAWITSAMAEIVRRG